MFDTSKDREVSPDRSNRDLNARDSSAVIIASHDEMDPMPRTSPRRCDPSGVNRVSAVQSQVDVEREEENVHRPRVIEASSINIWRREYRTESCRRDGRLETSEIQAE